jgi:hypothetical protein
MVGIDPLEGLPVVLPREEIDELEVGLDSVLGDKQHHRAAGGGDRVVVDLHELILLVR